MKYQKVKLMKDGQKLSSKKEVEEFLEKVSDGDYVAHKAIVKMKKFLSKVKEYPVNIRLKDYGRDQCGLEADLPVLQFEDDNEYNTHETWVFIDVEGNIRHDKIVTNKCDDIEDAAKKIKSDFKKFRKKHKN